jgi:alcohol dehydrogenase
MTPQATWSYPTKIRFGAGCRAELAQHCREAGIDRPLVVTDPGLVDLPLIVEILALLKAGGCTPSLFSEVSPNPLESNVDAGIAAFRAGACDGVVAVGGGSALDAGKTVAFMLPQTRPVWDFEDVGDNWRRAKSEGIAPIVAVPTTAGTGSEVGRAAVIAADEGGAKKIIFHPKMLPVLALEDPELTVGLPPALTAATGFDALAHCLEAYCAPSFHPLGEGIAVEGARLVAEYLPRAYADGGDVEARGMMMVAASMGAVAFQKGLGAIHALSHPVGSLYKTHHGRTNAVVMPYVLAFNRPAIEPKIARLAAYMGLAEASFDGFLAWEQGLAAELGIERDLAALGVDDSRMDELVALALADPTAAGNPVPLDDAGVRRLFAACLEGRPPAPAAA